MDHLTASADPKSREARIRRFIALRHYLRHVVPEFESESKDLEQQLVDELGAAAMEKLSLQGGDGVWLKKPRFGAGYDSRDLYKVWAWLEKQGCGGIIKEQPTIHHGTFSATVADLMDRGVPVPDFVSTWTKQSLGWRKGSES